MRILIGLGIGVFMLLGAQSFVSAEEIKLQTKSVLNHNSLSYVPTKIVTKQLEAPVTWNNIDKSMIITKDHTTISLKMGESKAFVNEQAVNTPPIIVKDGVSYLPLRFIAETFNMKVQWSPETISLTSYDTYTVQPGDYLYKIAEKVGLSVADIQKINNLPDDKLQIGQTLFVTRNKAAEAKVMPPPTMNMNNAKGTSTIYDDMIDQEMTIVSVEKEEKTEVKVEEQTENEKDLVPLVPENKSTIKYIPYTVKKGDTLSTISITNKISLKDLLAYNGLNESSLIYIGDELRLPKREISKQVTTDDDLGEYLDWWTEAQYVFPIGDIAMVTDFETGISFQVRRSYGANHADCEPLTAEDTEIAKEVWGGFTWNTRAVIIHTEDRNVAASMSFMPHDIQSILDNEFEGHFDIHFKNSTRHKDGKIDPYHQEKIKVAAGVE